MLKHYFIAFIILFFSYSITIAQEEKPNILFILTDDQSYEALSAFGSQVKTPNIDKLVNEGTNFSHAYNMGAWGGAVCVASRTQFITGRSLWNSQKAIKKHGVEADKGNLWPQILKTLGYDTYMIGKWHVNMNPEKIFDHVILDSGGMHKQTREGYNRPIVGKEDVWSPYDKSFLGYWKGGKHWTEVIRDTTIRCIKDIAQKETPFFMYLAFKAPHDPRQSPKEYIDMYPLEEIEVPVNFIPEYKYQYDIGLGKKLRDEKLAPFPRTEHAIKVHRQEYYALITHLDEQIGYVLDALEKSGKMDNTYIFFTSDHGLAVGHHGLMGKQNMYEHSLRAPLIVKGKGIPENKTVSARVYIQDVVPTTIEYAGGEIPGHIDFNSLKPFIDGEKKNRQYNNIYGAYKNLQRMIIDENMKLIFYPAINKFLLYDLEKDPDEMKDLSENPGYAKDLAILKIKLQELQKELNDPLAEN